ncbi:MAG: hypothetical protein KAT49_04835 [Methanomicrobia archaeon]|nr:hypothetical protein [Methanomicrobia archaeon]
MGTKAPRSKGSISPSLGRVFSSTVKTGIRATLLHSTPILLPQYASIIFTIYNMYKLTRLGWRFMEVYKNISYGNVENFGKETSTWILSKVTNKLGEETLYSDQNIDSHIMNLKKEGIFRDIAKILIKFRGSLVSEQELEKVSDDLIYIYRGTITQMSKGFLEEFTKEMAKEGGRGI